MTVPLLQVRGRGLPDDHAGPIRVVTIEGVDSNMCCGTHVSNLSDLQVSVEGYGMSEDQLWESGLGR